MFEQSADAAKNAGEQLSVWAVILIAMATGLSGELLRASKQTKLSRKELVFRILMRFTAAGFSGFGVFVLASAAGASQFGALGFCIVAALMGADVVTSLFERWAVSKLGVSEDEK